MGFWPVVLNVLKNSDLVLLVCDARLGEGGVNSEIVKKVERMRKRLVYVFNKIDLVSRKDVEVLREKFPGGFFVSCRRRKEVKKLLSFLEELASRKSSLRGKAHFSNGKARFAEDGEGNYSRGGSLRVGVVGYPNVGKSSLVNLIVGRKGAKVSSRAGTTKGTQWIRVGNLRIVDSPGVIPFGDGNIKLGSMGGKDVRKFSSPERVAFYLLEKNGEAIGRFYCVKGDPIRQGSNGTSEVEELFEAIGRKKGFLVKGGEVDENRTAVKILEDWNKGRIKLL